MDVWEGVRKRGMRIGRSQSGRPRVLGPGFWGPLSGPRPICHVDLNSFGKASQNLPSCSNTFSLHTEYIENEKSGIRNTKNVKVSIKIKLRSGRIYSTIMLLSETIYNVPETKCKK